MSLERHQFRPGASAQAEKLGVQQVPDDAVIDAARQPSQGLAARSPDGDRQVGEELVGFGVLGQKHKFRFRSGPMGCRRGGLPPEGLAESCRRWFPADVRIPARGHHLPRGVDQNQPCEGPSGVPAAVAGAQGIRQHRRRSLWFRVSFQLLPQGGRLRDRLQGAAAACEEGFELLPLGLGDLAGLLEVVEHQGALELLQRHPLVGEQGHQPHPEEGEGEATGDRELGGIPPQPIQPGRRGHE